MAELWPGGPLELPLEFTFDDRHLILPEVPTHRLLLWLATGSWWELLPQAVEFDGIAPLVMRLLDPDDYGFDFEQFWEPAITLFAGLAGTRPREGLATGWWPAVRLAATAMAQWPVYTAWCVTHGSHPLDGPLWLVVGRIYAWLRDGRDEKSLAKLEQEIWAPPPIVMTAISTADLPQHVRDEEAALALQALNEAIPGMENNIAEWRPPAPA